MAPGFFKTTCHRTHNSSSLHMQQAELHLGLPRAGYHSKIFDTGNDTNAVTSLPVPELYFFQYQIYNTKINYDITHYGTNLFIYFSAPTK